MPIRIPFIRRKDMKSFYVSIDIRLSFFENLKDAPILLEAAIWKSKIVKQNDRNMIVLVLT